MKFLSVVAFVLSPIGHAVTVKNCPNSITVKYGSVRALSDQELKKVVEDFKWETYEDAEVYRNEVASAQASDYQDVVFILSATKSGECRYLRTGEKAEYGENETRLVTKQGRDLIRVSLKLGENNFWIYHELKSYSPHGIVLQSNMGEKIYSDFSDGAPNLQFGWANSPDIR